MEIKPAGYKNSILLPQKLNNFSLNQSSKQDLFVSSRAENVSQVSFGGGFFSDLLDAIRGKKQVEQVVESSNSDYQDFRSELSKGIKEVLGKDIPPSNLKNIMSPDEFRKILPTFTTDSFIDKEKNIRKGIYVADLDCETNYTKGGKKSVFTVLDEVAKFADDYYERTGKKFIFALADRDTLDSTMHAIRIIGENPKKFNNVKFVPALKISYTHEAPNSKLSYENANFIVYGVNPFSSPVRTMVELTSRKRKRMVIDFISEVNRLYPEFAYSVQEIAKQNKFKSKNDFAVSNLYWRAREYAEKKGETEMKRVHDVPEDIIKKADHIISELGRYYVGSGYEDFEGPDSDMAQSSDLHKTIKGVFQKYSTHYDPEKRELFSSAENIFEDVIDCFAREPQKPVIAFAAPYYLCHDFDTIEDREQDVYPEVVNFMEGMQKQSKGMIEAFQSVVPFYKLDKGLKTDTIRSFNEYIKAHSGLYEVGGSIYKDSD